MSRGFSGATLTPEQIVAGKVTQFAEDRLRIAHAMAERFKVSVPPDVEKFFQAVAAGRWEELNVAFKALRQRRESGNGEDWACFGDPFSTQLIAECAHDWPAQKLLDYGDATLGALRPGMVYVGGTDPGRGIPTLLNETNDGERRIVITQNGLADESYLQYLDFLYGDRVATLTSEDSQRAFQDYMADAQNALLTTTSIAPRPNRPIVWPCKFLRQVLKPFMAWANSWPPLAGLTRPASSSLILSVPGRAKTPHRSGRSSTAPRLPDRHHIRKTAASGLTRNGIGEQRKGLTTHR